MDCRDYKKSEGLIITGVCKRSLPEQFVIGVYRSSLEQESAIGVWKKSSSQEFDTAVCHGSSSGIVYARRSYWFM
jgi:hypothetical protein